MLTKGLELRAVVNPIRAKQKVFIHNYILLLTKGYKSKSLKLKIRNKFYIILSNSIRLYINVNN